MSNKEYSALGVIPARYGSTRFPGKPLVQIDGKSMIRRVYEQASGSAGLSRVVVATDDDRICSHVRDFGGEAIMTSTHHRSGTERIGEVLEILELSGEEYPVVVNIQGDEPMLDPGQIDRLIQCFRKPETQIGTLVMKIIRDNELLNPNVVKVVMDQQQNALYFSRATIPHLRDIPAEEWLLHGIHYKHIGLYAYRTDVLKQIVKLPAGSLETVESLEQLRWLENGFRISVVITEHESIAIDTPEDLLKLTNKIG